MHFPGEGKKIMYQNKLYSKVSKVSGLNSCWDEIRHLGTTRMYEKGQAVDFSRDNSFFYIRSGKVKLTHVESNGQEQTMLFAEAGSIINIVAQFIDDSKALLMTFLERSEVVVFHGRLLTDPDFVSRYPKQIISLLTSLAVHLEIHSQQVGDISLLTSLSHLCRIFWDIYRLGNGELVIDPNMTQQELAALLGVNRTTLTRSLGKLRDMGVISAYTKHCLAITDVRKLQELAERQ